VYTIRVAVVEQCVDAFPLVAEVAERADVSIVTWLLVFARRMCARPVDAHVRGADVAVVQAVTAVLDRQMNAEPSDARFGCTRGSVVRTVRRNTEAGPVDTVVLMCTLVTVETCHPCQRQILAHADVAIVLCALYSVGAQISLVDLSVAIVVLPIARFRSCFESIAVRQPEESALAPAMAKPERILL